MVTRLAVCVTGIVLGLHPDHDLYRDAWPSYKDLSADLDDLF
ncbi:MAG: hypothetical protein WAS49_02285 [Candidatus Dechloromonas phosphoritropha]